MANKKKADYSAEKIPAAFKNYVGRVVKSAQETKTADTYSSNTVDYSGNIVSFSGVSQGTTSATRIGSKIEPVRALFQFDTTIGDTTNLVRFIVFQWHEDSAVTAPTAAAILEPSYVGTAQAPIAFPNFLSRKRYTILYDRRVQLDVDSPQLVWDVALYGKKLPKAVSFPTNGAANTLHGLYVLVISDSSIASHPSATMNIRLMYKDA